MEPIAIRVPHSAEISNYLYPVMDLEDFTQDLVTVRLPTGYYIDVGWYPEHDSNGRFVVRVFKEFWDQQELHPYETRNLSHLITTVEDLAERFSRTTIPMSRGGHMKPVTF